MEGSRTVTTYASVTEREPGFEILRVTIVGPDEVGSARLLRLRRGRIFAFIRLLYLNDKYLFPGTRLNTPKLYVTVLTT